MNLLYLIILFNNVDGFISRLNRFRPNLMQMQIKESVLVDSYKISIYYKLTKDQIDLIQNNINKHTEQYYIYSINNNYMICLNMYYTLINNSRIFNSYISVLVKDKYINIYGEYILEYIKPKYIQSINKTNLHYYFYSNESLISFYIDTNDNLDIKNKHNISFIYNNITKNINHIDNQKLIDKYIVNITYYDRLIYHNITFCNANKITYTINDYTYDLFR
jgi:hypothetical protein